MTTLFWLKYHILFSQTTTDPGSQATLKPGKRGQHCKPECNYLKNKTTQNKQARSLSYPL